MAHRSEPLRLRVGRDGRPHLALRAHGVAQLHAGHLRPAHGAPRRLHDGLAVAEEGAEAAVEALREHALVGEVELVHQA